MKHIIIFSLCVLQSLTLCGQSTIIKSTTKGQYIRSSIALFKWKTETGGKNVRSLGSTGVRISFGICDAAEIFLESRIHQIKRANKKYISGGNIAGGMRYNFFKSFAPLQLPRYIALTFFDNFYCPPLNKNLGYFVLGKVTRNGTLAGVGISNRVGKPLTLSLEATVNWRRNTGNDNLSEISGKSISHSEWIGLAIIYHLN